MNTLHQLSTSVAFASKATELELEGKLNWVTSPMVGGMLGAALLFLCIPLRLPGWKRKDECEEEEIETEEGQDKKEKNKDDSKIK